MPERLASLQDLVHKGVDPLTRELNYLDNVLTMFRREGGNNVIALLTPLRVAWRK